MIDEISLKILKILQNKARIPNVEVARQVGMAPSAVLERIRKLEKQGFIDGYEVRLNPQRFHRTLVGFIHVTTETSADSDDLIQRLVGMEDVQEVHEHDNGDRGKARSTDQVYDVFREAQHGNGNRKNAEYW